MYIIIYIYIKHWNTKIASETATTLCCLSYILSAFPSLKKKKDQKTGSTDLFRRTILSWNMVAELAIGVAIIKLDPQSGLPVRLRLGSSRWLCVCPGESRLTSGVFGHCLVVLVEYPLSQLPLAGKNRKSHSCLLWPKEKRIEAPCLKPYF